MKNIWSEGKIGLPEENRKNVPSRFPFFVDGRSKTNGRVQN